MLQGMDQLESLSVETPVMSSYKVTDSGSSSADIISKSTSGVSLVSSQATQRTKCSSELSSDSNSARGATRSSSMQTPHTHGSSIVKTSDDCSLAPSSTRLITPFVNPVTRGGGKTVLGGIPPSMQGLLRRRARFSGWKTDPIYFEVRSSVLLSFSGTGSVKYSGKGFGSGHGHSRSAAGGGSFSTVVSKFLNQQQKQVGDWSWDMDLAGAERILPMPTLSKKECFAFSIEFPSGSKKKALVLGASSFEARDRWINVLDQARHRVYPEDFDPLAVIGEGHFGKVLLVRWKNGAAAVREKLPSTTRTPRLMEEGEEAQDGEQQRGQSKVKGNGDRYLAVKEVALQKGMSLPGVLNERQILGVLREHPFVVTLRCAWRRGNFLYYGLDFMPGADLFELFRRNALKMDLQTARVYGGQIALALEHLHAHGICYRDLKPENILVDAKGYLRLADMGLSKILGTGPDALRTSTVCGTRAYLSPEMILRKPYGLSVDFWQFGCFVFELYAGHSPFWTPRSGPSGRVNDQTVALILAGEVNYPKSICKIAKSFIRELLHHDVDYRLGCRRVSGRVASVGSAAGDPSPQAQPREVVGWSGVKQHAFFDGMDWEALLRGEIPAPLKPGASGRSKVGNFAREYTRQRARWGGDRQEVREFADKEPLFRNELMGFEYLRD